MLAAMQKKREAAMERPMVFYLAFISLFLTHRLASEIPPAIMATREFI